jgi:hypothetical protein
VPSWFKKTRYLRHARVSKAKLRQVLRFFCADLTASQATQLTGLDRKTTLRLVNGDLSRVMLQPQQRNPLTT